MYVYVWLFITPYFSAFLCITLNDPVWSYIIMHDYVWLYMTVYDFVRVNGSERICRTFKDYIWHCITLYIYEPVLCCVTLIVLNFLLHCMTIGYVWLCENILNIKDLDSIGISFTNIALFYTVWIYFNLFCYVLLCPAQIVSSLFYLIMRQFISISSLSVSFLGGGILEVVILRFSLND